MSVKASLLSLLEAHRGEPVSGQALADALSVSRTAVWKAANALKKEGHLICGTQNLGYTLSEQNDILSYEGVRRLLPKQYGLRFYKEIDSTNSEAKRLILSGIKEETLVLADSQSAGRGRRGRSFYSPAGSGIYMSLILFPGEALESFLFVTAAAAVAVCEAMEALTDKSVKIKWVNDIFLDRKKIGGILTEAVSNFESGDAECVIVGIGINISTSEFPKELRTSAASLLPDRACKNELAAKIAEKVFSYSENLSDPRILSEYKARSLVLGKKVSYEKASVRYEGIATDINEQGNLLVKTDTGTEVLRFGEVSVRL